MTKLDEIRAMEKTDKSTITTEAQLAIQAYFKNEISQLINISTDNYNFPAAIKKLKEVEEFYPESKFLLEQTDEFEFNKKQKITDLYNNYIAALKGD